MLQTIRERAQGLVAIIIIAFLCLTFAVWGVESYLNAAREVVVAEIDGDEVLLQEYQSTFQRLRQRAQAELGEAFDSAMWTTDATKRQALDYVIEDRVLTQNVDRARIRITAEQLAEYLRNSPNFQVDGKFSGERYEQVASMLGFDARSYEAQARKDLALQQLRTGVVASAFVTSAEISEMERIKAQTRDIAYAVLTPGDSAKEGISDQDARTFFESHKEDYRVEDRVSLEYVELKLSDLMSKIEVSEDDVKRYYDAHKADFTVEEQRSANHILIQVKADATGAEDAAAKQKALDARKLVLDGKPFEEVAKEQSDDIGSRAEGGATGMFGHGVMVPEFEQAAFGMKVGEISEPVKTKFGYHIIRLNEIKPGGLKPLEEARGDIEERVRKEKAEELYYETAERFSDTVYEHPDSLTESADQLEVPVQTTSAQTREEIAAAFNPAVADAVWEIEVLTQGLVSAPVEIGEDRIVAVRVTKYDPSHLPRFEDVKAVIVAQLQSQRVRDAAKARGEALLERIRKGEAGAAIASEEKLTWEAFKGAKRDDERVNRAVLRAAFKARLDNPEEKAHFGVSFGSGNYAIVEVSGAADGHDSAEAASLAGLKEQVARVRTVLAWKDFVSSLKASARIEMHPEKL